tara:strand:- start:2930 stop:3184 length:255 start_codon:yes stop_codon:yes gene_type:complete
MGLKDSEIKGRIARSAIDEVIIEKGKYWGINVVDIRWYKDGKATSKGIRVNMQELVHMANILDRILGREKHGKHTRNRENDKVE